MVFAMVWGPYSPHRGGPFLFWALTVPIWGPILFGAHLGTHLEAEGRHYGGRRPTFWRGVGRRSPPTNCGGCGGGRQPPPPPTPNWCRIFVINRIMRPSHQICGDFYDHDTCCMCQIEREITSGNSGRIQKLASSHAEWFEPTVQKHLLLRWFYVK